MKLSYARPLYALVFVLTTGSLPLCGMWSSSEATAALSQQEILAFAQGNLGRNAFSSFAEKMQKLFGHAKPLSFEEYQQMSADRRATGATEISERMRKTQQPAPAPKQTWGEWFGLPDLNPTSRFKTTFANDLPNQRVAARLRAGICNALDPLFTNVGTANNITGSSILTSLNTMINEQMGKYKNFWEKGPRLC